MGTEPALRAEVALPRRPARRRIARVPLPVMFFMGFLLVLILSAVLADYLAPADPYRQSLRGRLDAPSWLGGTTGALLGTDQLGRDILSRILFGSRISLLVGFTAVIIGGLLGSLLGLIAGYAGRVADEVIMTVADIQLAFPLVLLAIAVVAVLGPSLENLILVVGLSGWVTYARIARAQVLSLKQKEFIEAVRALGGSDLRILFRHLLPNTLSPLIVVATLDLARTIVLESTLSFLGLGVQPPTPSWGQMIGEGREYLIIGRWWVSVFPGIVLMLTTMAVNRIGDWVRDVLDPTLRNV